MPVIFRIGLCLFLQVLPLQSHAQLTGEYFLSGVMETGSGFRLNEDSTFNFFYSYGAVDRFADCRWSVNGDKVVLNSDAVSEGFQLALSEMRKENKFTVRIIDENKQVLPYTIIEIKGEEGSEIMNADNEGKAIFKKQRVNTITLHHEIWVNPPQVIIVDPGMNYFEFTIHPDIMKISIIDLELTVAGEELHGIHPLLKGEKYIYIKD